jgi:hypothetical protein
MEKQKKVTENILHCSHMILTNQLILEEETGSPAFTDKE